LCATAAALGPGTAEQAIGQAGSPDRLLELLASAWLMTMDASGWRALGLAVQVEYCNAALSAAALAGAEPPSGPWLQPLAHGWSRVRPAWKASLAAALTSRAPADGGAVRRVADFLLAHGVPERAVPLYLDLGDTDGGARAIADPALAADVDGGFVPSLEDDLLVVRRRAHDDAAAADGTGPFVGPDGCVPSRTIS
jgi:hypothetical protein